MLTKIILALLSLAILTGCPGRFEMHTLDIMYDSNGGASTTVVNNQVVYTPDNASCAKWGYSGNRYACLAPCYADVAGVRQCSEAPPTTVITATPAYGYWSGGIYGYFYDNGHDDHHSDGHHNNGGYHSSGYHNGGHNSSGKHGSGSTHSSRSNNKSH